MNTHELTAAINGAVVHLGWLNADRYTEALRLVAQVPIDLEEITASGGGDIETRDRRAIGGHSDPTGDAVAASADRQARLADRAEVICDTARWLRATIAGITMPTAPGTLTAAQRDLEWILSVSDATWAWQPCNDGSRRQIATKARLVYHEAAGLQCEVEQALRYSATVAAGRPKPKPLRYCRCCEPWGYRELALAKSDLCEVCEAFRFEHKCWPTKSIRDDRAMGRKRVRPGQLAEAKAQRRNRKTQRSA